MNSIDRCSTVSFLNKRRKGYQWLLNALGLKVTGKVANKGLDSNYQLSVKLLTKFDYLFFEDLTLAGMKALCGWKISDYGFATFLKILETKSREHGKTFHKVGRFFPSTKLCSSLKCGQIKLSGELTLKDRVFKCECCGL